MGRRFDARSDLYALGVIGVIDKRPGSEEANLIVNELIKLDDLSARYGSRLDAAAAFDQGLLGYCPFRIGKPFLLTDEVQVAAPDAHTIYTAHLCICCQQQPQRIGFALVAPQLVVDVHHAGQREPEGWGEFAKQDQQGH